MVHDEFKGPNSPQMKRTDPEGHKSDQDEWFCSLRMMFNALPALNHSICWAL